MKRSVLWSVLFLAGAVVWWGSQLPAMAAYSPNNYIGLPFDGYEGGLVRDHSPERSGWDRHSDRDPDGDSAGSADDREHDNDPDCRNATGDGIGFVVGFMGAGENLNAGPCGSWGEGGDGTPFADDFDPERPNKGPGDFISDGVPDRHTAPGFNRIGDKYYDEDPDNKNCDGGSAYFGECERNTAEVRDYFTDNTPDAPLEGPNDHVSDNYLAMMGTAVTGSGGSHPDPFRAGGHSQGTGGQTNPDEGGYGYGGGGGGGGCSLVAGQAADPALGLAYLLVLFVPVVLVVIQRKLRRK